MAGRWSLGEAGVLDIPLTGDCTASIVLVGGSLAVLAGQGPDARVEVSAIAGPPLGVTVEGTALRIEHHREPGGHPLGGLRRAVSTFALPSAHLAVHLPESSPVAVTVGTANVYVEALRGRLRVISGSGPVTIDRLAGDLDVKSGLGAVTVRRSTPRRAAFATMSAAVDVELADPRCLLTASLGGALTVTAPAPSGLDLTATTRGPVSVDGRDVLPDDVQDALPDDVQAGGAADARSGGDGARGPRRTGVPTLHHADGDRALVIKAKLRSGTVTVLRA